ncbi:MAG TPA: 4a-hydroxytetrahydrobiopterin dehydratase [Phycisphaerales bacterium]|nr:4a-hydroxytetrahydrobiopterin dehydratase [Phycisphaerales bacterium]
MASGNAPVQKMTEAQVEERLESLNDWSFVGESIQRTYQFATFVTAMKFVDSIAVAAEAAQHHPDILIRHSKVTLTLMTHDAGGITSKDFDLATKADEIAARVAKRAVTNTAKT